MAEVNNRHAKVTIKIPRPLYDKIAEVIDGAGYNSVTDFVVYVMRDLVASHRTNSAAAQGVDQLAAVKARLRALGYFGESQMDDATRP